MQVGVNKTKILPPREALARRKPAGQIISEMKELEVEIRNDAVAASARAPAGRDEQEKYRLQRVSLEDEIVGQRSRCCVVGVRVVALCWSLRLVS